jgi:hypothetical protein
MGENMNKKIVNIGIAAVVCVLYFPLILMLLQLTKSGWKNAKI